MSLHEQLSTLKAQNTASLPEEIVAVMQDETEKLSESVLSRWPLRQEIC